MSDVKEIAAIAEHVDAQPEVAAPEAEVAPPEDNRQLWYCVDPYGPRSNCPSFRSDAHLTYPKEDIIDPRTNLPTHPVICPKCGSAGRSVMRAEQFDEAHPPTPPRDPRAPLPT